MSRLNPLIRITGEMIGVWGAEEGEAGRLTTGHKLGKPSRCVVTHNLEANSDKAVAEWAQEMTKAAGKVDGWVRLRDEGDVDKYFVVQGMLLLSPCPFLGT